MDWVIPDDYTHIFIYGGSTVPGRYLGANIGSFAELKKLLQKNYHPSRLFYIDGALRFLASSFRLEIENLGGIFLYPLELWLNNSSFLPSESREESLPPNYYDLIQPSAITGAKLLPQHIRFPYNMIELESSRGCNRKIHCSFCSDGIEKTIISRKPEQIIEEIASLYENGARYFRIGCQSDLLTFQANSGFFKNGFPKPNPKALEQIYGRIHQLAPDLKVLHLDNINPGVISAWEEESKEVLKIIVSHNTPHDVAAMGLESTDSDVIKLNQLKITPKKMLKVLNIIHEIGHRDNEHKLNPGLNFLSGLPGENMNTFQKNYEFLQEVQRSGILLRRINIRKVRIFEKTPLFHMVKNIKWKYSKQIQNRFEYYKKKIRREIDLPMLKKIYPKGIILKDVILEQKESWGFTGRPMGTYPITVKILASEHYRKKLEKMSEWIKVNVVVISHRERSLNAISLEDSINHFSLSELKKVFNLQEANIIWEKPSLEEQKRILVENSLDSLFPIKN